VPDGRVLNDQDRQSLFQKMLAERWQLRYHRETRNLRVYSLVNDGSTLVPHTGPGEYAMKVERAGPHVTLRSTRGNMDRMTEILRGFAGTVITNDTGLGGEYDFTFTQIVHIERRLVKHQLLELGEKPLTFAVDVERGIYSPKPITPASQLSLEILASAQGLNKANGEDKTTFSVRIYNSSANEKKIRAPEASFPAKGDDNPAYNHDELEVVWSFQNIDARKRFFEFYTDIGDRFVMEGKDFPVSGLKQVQATLKLKDTSSLPGQPIFTDTVSFEVYTHVNLTYARAASNVTTTDTIIVQWPVEPTAQRVYAVAQLRDVPPQGQCAVPGGGMNDCLVVSDGGSKRVVDQRSGEPMKFETTSLSNYSYGNWKFEIRPNAPGQTGVFEIVVRYRAGV